MKTTFISLPGHGYYKYPVEFLKGLNGFDPEKVSPYSGLTLTHLYAEEDCDATYIQGLIEKSDIKETFKTVYQNKTVSHNYNPKLFGYTPKVGDKVKLRNNKIGTISGYYAKGWKVFCGETYGLPYRNTFEYLIDICL